MDNRRCQGGNCPLKDKCQRVSSLETQIYFKNPPFANTDYVIPNSIVCDFYLPFDAWIDLEPINELRKCMRCG